MVTINVKAMLSQMTLTDESIGVFVANCFQGLITIDDFDQLNEKSVEGLCQVLRNPGGTIWVLSNNWITVSGIDEARLQGIIYYIKYFKRIGRTCMHADFDPAKFRVIYHRQGM